MSINSHRLGHWWVERPSQARWEALTRALRLRRYRNHPSIVLWSTSATRLGMESASRWPFQAAWN